MRPRQNLRPATYANTYGPRNLFRIHPLTNSRATEPGQLLPSSKQHANFLPAYRSSPSIPPHALFSTSAYNMASDDAYAAFLDKANADLDAGRAPQQGTASSHTQTKAVDSSLKLPSALQSVEEYYVSDADEPFEPVLLRWEGAKQGKWPSAGTCRSGKSLPFPSLPIFHVPPGTEGMDAPLHPG